MASLALTIEALRIRKVTVGRRVLRRIPRWPWLGSRAGAYMRSADARLQDNKLILEAPFPGIDAFIQYSIGMNLPGSLVSDISGAKVEDPVAELRGPLLWIHGKANETIPYEVCQGIFNNYGTRIKNPLPLKMRGTMISFK